MGLIHISFFYISDYCLCIYSLYTWSCFNIDITAECPNPNTCLHLNCPTLVYLIHVRVDVLQPHVFSLPSKIVSIYQNYL